MLRLGSNRAGPELFGYISMADIAPDGKVVVLDADAQEVRIFDLTGAFIGGFGGRGDGPMELRRATEFHLFPDGRIAVALGKMGPIKVFEQSGGEWRLAEILDLRPTPANSLCGMKDGRLFSAGYMRADDTILNEFVAAGNRSWGRGYRHEHSFIRMALSDGLVACLDGSDRVVFGFQKLPLVRSYGADGTLHWTAAVTDYLQLQVWESREEETGAVAYSESTSKDHDRLAVVAGLTGGDHLLLQYSRVLNEHRRIVPRSYLVDASTGIGAYLGDTLPNVLSVQSDTYIAVFEDPYYYLEVRRLPSMSPATSF